MFAAYLAVTGITILINVGVAAADLGPAGFVRSNSAEVGVPLSWLPALASLKLAGACGLLLGLFDFRAIGLAAAIGLVLFYLGAVTVHVRARVFYNIAFPGTFLAFAGASLALALSQ